MAKIIIPIYIYYKTHIFYNLLFLMLFSPFGRLYFYWSDIFFFFFIPSLKSTIFKFKMRIPYLTYIMLSTSTTKLAHHNNTCKRLRPPIRSRGSWTKTTEIRRFFRLRRSTAVYILSREFLPRRIRRTCGKCIWSSLEIWKSSGPLGLLGRSPKT